jgi:predicted glycogen debranching enzyme
MAGRFGADLEPGGVLEVEAWTGDLGDPPPGATEIVARARARVRRVAAAARPADDADRVLVLAADRFVVAGPAVVAGYPWFGEWSRDGMIAHEGLFLETGREAEGREVLLRAAGLLSEGMLANTTDSGAPEYNTADGTLWFCHAAGRQVERTGDQDLAAALAPALEAVLAAHVAGTRFGIRVDPADGLLAQGEPGVALTWMDARVDGVPVTARSGKAVEVCGLWLRACEVAAGFARAAGRDPGPADGLAARARAALPARFVRAGAVLDVVDGPAGDDPALRPNALVAASLPGSPLPVAQVVHSARARLLTSLGLRSLAPGEPGYRGRHRGGPVERDAAYHQGTVWPWLIGPMAAASLACGEPVDGLLAGLEAHLGEWGLGAVSETADGDPPHGATGCPFQAWSVAEVLRARRLVARAGGAAAD